MTGPHPSSERREVLYVIACGSPLARHVGRLVELAHQDGWDVCVVTTPDGAKFVDRAALARQTGHPVRTHYKNPGDFDVLPQADAMIVCPATVNTVNKWAAGITDTLALGLLVEAQGLGVPVVAVPYTNTAMAAHPAFRAGVARLAEWGVTVLFGDDFLPLHAPGTGERHLHAFPWAVSLAAVRDRLCPVA
ncbi:flavoprotein [Micromonospora peucetia]|uniref:Flavoprotein n=1 Tax=Micromonospora peucetia TaxID=47871 RepID=A0A1C6VN01_9ACTN|nr:flavoprotein [Micromonospora peucetia]MCX4388703.1 flavoprotein [Micromonospora peucetia]WSA30658.1 flavoprotein [Micromonospora peucetia]SCL67622.1 Flavoprotein [Micromonospora peucetia]